MDDFAVQSVEVVPVQATASDLRKRQHANALDLARPSETTYLVKIYLYPMPTPDDLGFELYVGDRRIRQYSQFERGVYFKLRTEEQLRVYDGQQVRFRRPQSREFMHSDVVFPAFAAELAEAAEASTPRRSLPTAEEALRE